jgi:hypothetical protein
MLNAAHDTVFLNYLISIVLLYEVLIIVKFHIYMYIFSIRNDYSTRQNKEKQFISYFTSCSYLAFTSRISAVLVTDKGLDNRAHQLKYP